MNDLQFEETDLPARRYPAEEKRQSKLAMLLIRHGVARTTQHASLIILAAALVCFALTYFLWPRDDTTSAPTPPEPNAGGTTPPEIVN